MCKIKKELAKGRNAWKSFGKVRLLHACMENRHLTKYAVDDDIRKLKN